MFVVFFFLFEGASLTSAGAHPLGFSLDPVLGTRILVPLRNNWDDDDCLMSHMSLSKSPHVLPREARVMFHMPSVTSVTASRLRRFSCVALEWRALRNI